METKAQASTGGIDKTGGVMDAIVQKEYGSWEMLEMTKLPVPDIEADEVLVSVHAAGVDRGVWHLMTGLPYAVRLSGFGLTRPKTEVPGLDLSGRVVAVGADVSRFEVGDEVFGIGWGAYADYAVAKESKLAHKPDGASFEQAAVAAVSGITALQALTDVSDVQAGQKVLVIGASGGVGSYAVQIARALGAEVTGVASAAKAELVRSLGAERVIDYAAGNYLDGRTRYDVIIDTGGLNPIRKLRKALTHDGTLVVVGGEGGGRFTGGTGRQLRAVLLSRFVPQRLTTFLSKEHHSHIERLADLIATGSVAPAIGERYRLDEVPNAMRDLEEGRARGKSVVIIRDAKESDAR